MKVDIKLLLKYLILFTLGGLIYVLIEILWRGYSHISMFFLGGLCFVYCGLLNEIFTWETPLLLQMFISSLIITFFELVTGIIVNLYLNLNVWDYSNIPFNFLGQICLPFTIAWFFLSAAAIILDDYIRYWFFHEEKPRYKLLIW